ncbi:MAG: type III-A CRISPR-associated protein Csm2 [Calditerrivibrio sp.]|nr:type III-A CRISPR-associated protein Csm2 [Calditerrivibrio sp.]MCA1980815.1 type III-A CRISPR-associated protein Csm2 [Calditerrivibrio sp.]
MDRNFTNNQYGKFQKNPKPQMELHDIMKKSFNKDNDDATLISKNAEEVAEIIFKEYDYHRKSKNKNSQIRKFFDELFGIKIRLESSKDPEEEFKNVKPLIYLLASKAAYAKGREKIGENLYEFFKNNFLAISSYKDLKRFILYFEAILGYYKFKNPKES